jgi:hypothetical protein
MLGRILRKIRYVLQVFKIAGPLVLLKQLKGQVYDRATYVCLEKDLSAPDSPVQCAVKYTLHLATAEDMEEITKKARTESKDSARELVRRRLFYECGFHNCYVARTADSGELCHIKWIITAEDNDLISRGFSSTLPRLGPDEVMTENTFTFEKYRKSRIGAAVRNDLAEMMRRQGFKRAIGYVNQNNPAALKSFLIDGYRVFDELDELRLFFHTRRTRRNAISSARHQSARPSSTETPAGEGKNGAVVT